MDNQHKITGLHLTYALDSGDGVKKNVQLERPRRWNISFIRNFMITFGILSSVFDFLTFVVLLFILQRVQICSGLAGSSSLLINVPNVIGACLHAVVLAFAEALAQAGVTARRRGNLDLYKSIGITSSSR